MCHFTGEVTYDCRDWVRASCEVIPPAVVELLATSSCEIVREIGEVSDVLHTFSVETFFVKI